MQVQTSPAGSMGGSSKADPVIRVSNLNKSFKVFKGRRGLLGAERAGRAHLVHRHG